ncbi:MAG: HDOD domain-containing protein [Gemmatimonadales bacterium]|nr:HDOD domain-containing protein [Gemmatimonadales bacterium]
MPIHLLVMTIDPAAPRAEPFLVRLHQLLKSGEELPTLPTVVFEVQALLEGDRATTHAVAELLERDPALASRLLRAANAAAAMGRGGPVTSIAPAIQRLGLNAVWGLCLVASVVDAFRKGSGAFEHEKFWQHSTAVGTVARALWRELPLPEDGTPDELYVAGLLHDAGLLVLDQFFPDDLSRVAAVRAEHAPIMGAEEALLGIDHGEVGGLLLGRWGLPSAIVDPVAFHHRASGAPRERQAAARCVMVAELLCMGAGAGLDHEGAPSGDPTEELLALGFAPDQIDPLVLMLHGLAQEAAGTGSLLAAA